jgi:hypothetical protein
MIPAKDFEFEITAYKEKMKHHEKENDLILYLFNNKFMLEKKKKQPFYSTFPSYLRYCQLRDKVIKLLNLLLINYISLIEN